MTDFLCIGAQKSGTTLLYEHLKNINELYLPERKELHHYDSDINFYKGKEFYFDFFKSANTNQLKGEITPAYLYFDFVPRRIKETVGKNLKFIILLRNPIDRAYSQYNMSKLKQGHEHLSFEEALIYEPYRLKTIESKRNFSYLDRGFYSKQILNYYKYFNKKQFKIILYESFVKEQNKYVNEILDFLCLNKQVDIENKIIFENNYPPMKSSTRKLLEQIYMDEMNYLENIIDIDLSIWKEK